MQTLNEPLVDVDLPEHLEHVGQATVHDPTVPAEYAEADLTKAENELNDWLHAGQHDWTQSELADKEIARSSQCPTLSASAALLRRAAAMKEVEELGEVQHLASCSTRLQAFCRGHLLADIEARQQPSLERALQVAIERGDSALRTEAKKLRQGLLNDRIETRAGSPPIMVRIQDSLAFDFRTGQVGQGTVCSQSCHWQKYDFGDKLPVSEGLSSRTGWVVGELEEKQCMILNAAGAYLLAQQACPSLTEVLELSQSWREELYERAREADTNLGESPPLIT
eukprot:1692577-Amphidinium_carterae.1